MKTIVAQLGARMHYAVPEIFYSKNLLENLYTDFYYKDETSLLKILKKISPEFHKTISSRKSRLLPDEMVKPFIPFGLTYSSRKKFRAHTIENQISNYLWAGTNFNKLIIKDIEKRCAEFDSIYLFNTAGLELIKHYKGKKKIILEQCIAPHVIEKNIVSEEIKKFPNWERKIEYGKNSNLYAKKEIEELVLADTIICPSDFVKQSILAIDSGLANKIKVVPYGVKSRGVEEKKVKPPVSDELKVVTVGKLGLRKGTPYILELAKRFGKKINFRIVGDYSNLSSHYINELKKYTTITGVVSRREVDAHYKWADAFFLPSVCEGSATVTYEAMQYGLPLLVTANTGAIITHDKEGYVVESGNLDEMEYYLKQLYQNRNTIQRLSTNSLQKSHQANIDAYRKRLLNSLGI